MNNLAIIPARGGSKRIPKKNIKPFKGKPIISYAIEALKKSNIFSEIMISTDSEEIADVALEFGARVPFMRSTTNANDFATLTDVVLEVLNSYHKLGKTFDYVCCILPTAALITSKTIIEGYQKLNLNKFSTLVPVIRFAYPIQRALVENNGILKMRQQEYLNTRSQDLEPCYHDSGQFYWLNTEQFLIEKKIFSINTGYIELKEREAQDVDTADDWEMLELKYNFKNQ